MRINPQKEKDRMRYLYAMKSRLRNLRQKRKPDFNSAKSWLRSVKGAGVYGVFEKGKLVYVGETSSFQRRMGEVKQFLHVLPRRIFKIKKGQRITDKDRIRMRRWMEKHFEFAFLRLKLGRKELEEWIIKRDKPKYQGLVKR